jgi:hypothetical protein
MSGQVSPLLSAKPPGTLSHCVINLHSLEPCLNWLKGKERDIAKIFYCGQERDVISAWDLNMNFSWRKLYSAWTSHSVFAIITYSS